MIMYMASERSLFSMYPNSQPRCQCIDREVENYQQQFYGLGTLSPTSSKRKCKSYALQSMVLQHSLFSMYQSPKPSMTMCRPGSFKTHLWKFMVLQRSLFSISENSRSPGNVSSVQFSLQPHEKSQEISRRIDQEASK